MKKVVAIIVVFILTMHLTSVSAETFSTYLPGGKNYLNPENFTVYEETLYNLESIKVRPNQEYVLSFPNGDMLGANISVLVEGNDVYIDEYPIGSQCNPDSDTVTCRFTTSINETFIDIAIQGELMGLYYSYYRIDYFQLEEGSINTDYEAYIAPFFDASSPEFLGSGAFITSYDSEINISDIIDEHIVAYDDIDGELSDEILIVNDQYSGNETVVGDYLVELSVSDAAGNEATFNLYVLVKDEIAPTISGQNDIYLDVNEEASLNEVVSSYVSYSDEYDENPSLYIVQDEYSLNEAIIGSYSVTIEVVDMYNNVASKTITFHVEDYDPPILNSASIFDVDVSNPLTLIDIIDGLDVTDNYDEAVTMEITSDSFSGNESIVGTYFVDILLQDTSLNTSEFTITINISDSSNPVITGPTEIVTSYTEILSLEEIKQLLSVSDNYDMLDYNDIYLVADAYSENASVPGEYLMQFEVYDGTGNIGTYQMMITVVDDISPIIYIDQYIVVVDVGSSFGESDMMKLLRLSNEITHEDYEITVLQDEYKGNEDKIGDYIYKVKLEDSEGNEMIREFKITVSEDNDLDYTTPIIYTLISIAILTGALFYRKYK